MTGNKCVVLDLVPLTSEMSSHTHETGSWNLLGVSNFPANGVHMGTREFNAGGITLQRTSIP